MSSSVALNRPADRGNGYSRRRKSIVNPASRNRGEGRLYRLGGGTGQGKRLTIAVNIKSHRNPAESQSSTVHAQEAFFGWTARRVMDYYAADENYFTDHALNASHETLLKKLDEKKKRHQARKRAKRKAKRARRATATRRGPKRVRMAGLLVVMILLGMGAGWSVLAYLFQ